MAPVRVLHVVRQMNRAGTETWLMHVLRNVDRRRVRMDFVVAFRRPGEYDEEIRSLGSTLIACPGQPDPLRFGGRFLSVLREQGPFDVVHSHLHHFSGFVLALARLAGVPVRVAHSHLDTGDLDRAASAKRKVYLRAMRAALARFATHGIAASEDAATALYGPRWRDDPRWQVVHCALDLSPFKEPVDREAVRAELGVPPEAIVFGHVGRFERQKNHELLVRILAAAARRDPRAFAVLVGDGSLRAEVERECERHGVRGRVVFTGVRADVPRLLRSFDAFVLPSWREGLGLVGIEAQAAGLPVLCSDRVPRELAVVPALVTWLSLDEPPERWAEAALAAAERRVDPAAALALVEASDFSLPRSIGRLLAVYGAAARDGAGRAAAGPRHASAHPSGRV